MKKKILCAVVIACLVSCVGIVSLDHRDWAAAASVWVERTPAGDVNRNWLACASDATGQRLLAGDNGARLWISSDCGASWSEAGPPAGGAVRDWQACASDADGSTLIAGVYGGRLYVSANAGVSWSAAASGAPTTSQSWKAVASDADGSTLVGGVYGSRLWLSTNGGAGWSETRPAGNADQTWQAVACDANGLHIMALVRYGRVYASGDAGVTWSEVRPAGDVTRPWKACAMDADGSTLVAAAYAGRLYCSIDTGTTWAELRPAGDVDRNWQAVAVNADGSHLVAVVDGGGVWTSSDGGATWSDAQPAGLTAAAWQCCASSTDGSRLIAGAYQSRLYTGLATWLLSYACAAGGVITGATSQTVNYGASGTSVTAVPHAGYHFVSWSDASTVNPRTDTNVTADITVTATFAVDTFAITVISGSHGTVTPGTGLLPCHTAQAYVVEPDAGYTIDTLTVDGVVVNEATNRLGYTVTLTSIEGPHTIVAAFTSIPDLTAPVNDAPSFTKGAHQTVQEDCIPQTVAGWATSISAGPADEAEQDIDFIVTNDNTTLFSTQPALAANGALTYAPAANGNGTATVTVSIHDDGGTANGGVDTSAPQMFTITVTPVNDPPVNTVSPSIWGTMNVSDTLTANPGTWNDDIDTNVSGDPFSPTYTYQWVRADDASGTTAADIISATSSTYVLSDTDSHKYLRARVTCTDNGVGLPTTQSVTLFTPWTPQVINRLPVITEGASASATMDEDGSPIPFSLTLNATDADSDTLTWSILTPAAHGTAMASGTGLSKAIGYTPSADYNGSDSFMVQVNDGYLGTGTITVNVTVREVNDAPTAVADAYPMLEDKTLPLTTAQLLSNDLKGPTNESGPNLVLLGVGTSPVNCTVTLNAGTITVYLSPNFNGIASFDYTIQDNGTTAGAPDPKTASGIVTITVTPVNDAPSFTKGVAQTVLEDCSPQTVPGWATAISAGPADEAGQDLDFIVTNDNNVLFSLQPVVSSTGTLTYTPAANANGTATVTLTLTDDATRGGAALTTAPQTFSITVTPMNDPPVNTALPAISGTPHVGRTLATTIGDWNDAIDTEVSGTSVLSYGYQWQRSTDGGSTFTDITGATGSSYLLALPDNLQQVRVRVTCSNTGVGQPTPQSTTASSPPATILNAAPVITEGSAVPTSCDEDENPVPFSLTLPAIDADEIDTLTWHIVAPPAHGNLTLPIPAVGSSTTPSVYHPTANWNGTDSFTLRVEDGLTGTDEITVTVTVNSRNDAPLNTVKPSIGGNLLVNHEVRAVIGSWNDSIDLVPGHLTYTCQWVRARDAAGTGLALIPGATASTYIISPIDEGMYLAVRVTCTDDGEGLPVSMSTSADSAFLPARYLDMMPPIIELPDFSSWPGVTGISGGTAPSFTVNRLPFDLHFMVEDDRSGVQWKVSVNGVEASSSVGTFTRSLPLSEGRNDVVVTAVDAAGNIASRYLDITLDTHAPVVTLARPLQSMVTGTTLNVEGTITDDVSGVRSLTIDGTEVTPYLDGTFKVSPPLKRGLNTIEVETLDNAGNHGSFTWVVDLTAVQQPRVRHTIDLTIDSAVMVVDGASVTMDVAPVIRENRTLLPLRAIVEELDGSIAWNAKARQVTVKARGVTMVLTIGKNSATVNGKSILIDPKNSKVVPVILGSRTFLPLRFIAEKLGLDIAWYAPTRAVTIAWEP